MTHSRRTSSQAQRSGLTPSVAQAREDAERIRREAKVNASSAMVEAPMPDDSGDTEQVEKASARKLEQVRSAREPS